ncbi:MAG: hypothetical protein ABSE95_14530 [Thermodesulfobacteriota bacterium]
MTDSSELWFPISLKLEEAGFFLDQLKNQCRNPKHVLFNLSAFVSSARSVTCHIEKQLTSKSRKLSTIYHDTVKELLSDEFSKYFVGLRNRSLHQMYVKLAFQLVEHRKEGGKDYLVLHASKQPASPSDKHLSWLEEVLKVELHGTAQWVLPDFPGRGKTHLIYACEEYLQRLNAFIPVLRERIDSVEQHDT